MEALTLLIIRHAEKPGDAWPGPGLTEQGVADDKSLVIRGWQRTGAWTAMFGAGLGGDSCPEPKAIYAAAPAHLPLQMTARANGLSRRFYHSPHALA